MKTLYESLFDIDDNIDKVSDIAEAYNMVDKLSVNDANKFMDNINDYIKSIRKNKAKKVIGNHPWSKMAKGYPYVQVDKHTYKQHMYISISFILEDEEWASISLCSNRELGLSDIVYTNNEKNRKLGWNKDTAYNYEVFDTYSLPLSEIDNIKLLIKIIRDKNNA